MRTGGIVLCGGRSSRMGRPKAWLPFGAEALLSRVVRLLRQAVSPVVVVAAPGQEVPPVEGVTLVRDEHEGRGPMQGFAAGLSALRGAADAAFLSSCDVPLLRPAFVLRMGELLGEDFSIAAAEVGGFRQPLAAVYRLDVLDTVEHLLSEGRGRLGLLLERLPTRLVRAEELADVDPELESLRNVNTPEEYEAALAVWRQRGD